MVRVLEVAIRLQVVDKDGDMENQDAVDTAVSYFCGGDFYDIVTQLEPEVTELRYDESKSEAGTT